MKAFLVGLIFLLAVMILGVVGILLFPLLFVLAWIFRAIIMFVLVIVAVWLLGNFIIFVWEAMRKEYPPNG